MVCTPGYIWSKWSKAVFKHRDTGEGATFRVRKWLRLSFSECGVTVAVLYLKGHMERQHGRSVQHMREVDIRGGGDIYLCSVLPPCAEVGKITGDRLSGSSA